MAVQLQRRHFQFVADVLKNLPYDEGDDRVSRTEVVRAFSRALRSTNYQFSASRFEQAAGLADWRE